MKPSNQAEPVFASAGARRFSWNVLLALAAVVAAGWLAGCRSPANRATSQETREAGAATYVADVLREGDVIAITCESVTNINTTARIPINGKLDLPFIGQVLPLVGLSDVV